MAPPLIRFSKKVKYGIKFLNGKPFVKNIFSSSPFPKPLWWWISMIVWIWLNPPKRTSLFWFQKSEFRFLSHPKKGKGAVAEKVFFFRKLSLFFLHCTGKISLDQKREGRSCRKSAFFPKLSLFFLHCTGKIPLDQNGKKKYTTQKNLLSLSCRKGGISM